MADFAKFSINNHTYDVKDSVARGDISTINGAISNLQTDKENVSNKVTNVTASSTDTQYPSAKCVWDLNKLTFVDFGTTSYNTITNIVNDGKVPFCYDSTNKMVLFYTRNYNSMHHFTGVYFMEGSYLMEDYAVNTSNAWNPRGLMTFVKTVSSSSTNEQIPSAKSVYDFVTANVQQLYRHKITIYYDYQGDAAQVAFSVILSRSTAYTTNDAATLLTDLSGLTFAASGSFDSTGGDTCRLVSVEIENTMNITTIGYNMNTFTMDDRQWAPNDIDTLTDIVEAL